ncbi:hypothetical protein SESBI_01222 [Sesbania bispinosa]|nr:hypothetical protein SESBI_01222 [Sesbania bispinosa]
MHEFLECKAWVRSHHDAYCRAGKRFTALRKALTQYVPPVPPKALTGEACHVLCKREPEIRLDYGTHHMSEEGNRRTRFSCEIPKVTGR